MSIPAYHLRTNKIVERYLFVELLHRLDNHLPARIKEHLYVGLGGPYLEDFNLIHATFGSRQMISLEIDEWVITRQKINTPHSAVTLTPQSTTDFAGAFEATNEPLIVWFDYSEPKWEQQVPECCSLLQKLPPMSVFKVTLSGHRVREKPEEALAKLRQTFGTFGPFNEPDVYEKNICNTLYAILHGAIARAIPDSEDLCVRTLASYQYNDRTPILTVALIVGPIKEIEALFQKSALETWEFGDINWRGPREINVPNFGIRERLAIDQMLPDASAESILDKLQLQLAKAPEDSRKLMTNYVEFCKQVPQFVRVTF
jgi:hypothetical protein